MWNRIASVARAVWLVSCVAAVCFDPRQEDEFTHSVQNYQELRDQLRSRQQQEMAELEQAAIDQIAATLPEHSRREMEARNGHAPWAEVRTAASRIKQTPDVGLVAGVR